MPANNSVQTYLREAEGDSSKILGLSLNGKPITNGAYAPRAEGKTAPQITFTTAPTNPVEKYFLVALDLTAPFVSFKVLGPILHWIQPDLSISPTDQTLTTTSPPIANYIGPAPPPGSGPHQYAFFLYEQPAELDLKKISIVPVEQKGQVGNTKRMRFDLDAFEAKAGLSGKFVATGWFVSN